MAWRIWRPSPKAWQDIAANDLTPAFWALVQAQLGYTDAEAPACATCCCAYWSPTSAATWTAMRPASWPTLCCPTARLAANASVFVAHWRSDIAHFGSYNALARAVAQELDLAGLLAGSAPSS
jgi:hypothetical protein